MPALDFSTSCAGGDSEGTDANLKSLSVSTVGSFSKVFTATADIPNSDIPVNYKIRLSGHFHGVVDNGQGNPVSRAAGSYLVTGKYVKNGTTVKCSSNEYWWTAIHS
jgi:hypothetical protein